MSLQRWKGLNSEAEPKLDPNLTGIYTEAGEPVAIAVSKEYQQQIVIEHNLLVDILLPLAAYLPTLASGEAAKEGWKSSLCYLRRWFSGFRSGVGGPQQFYMGPPAPVAGTGYWDCECGGINSDILRRCVMCKRLRTSQRTTASRAEPRRR